MRTQTLTLTLALVCGVLGPLAATPASAMAAKVFVTTTSAATNLSAAGGVPTTILTLTVPAGEWLITSKADVVNFGAADYERCAINLGSLTEDGSTSTTEPASPVVDIKGQAVVEVSGSRSITLSCQHDDSTNGEYVDAGASLIAQKVNYVVRQ